MEQMPHTGKWESKRTDAPTFDEGRAGNANARYEFVHQPRQYAPSYTWWASAYTLRHCRKAFSHPTCADTGDYGKPTTSLSRSDANESDGMLAISTTRTSRDSILLWRSSWAWRTSGHKISPCWWGATRPLRRSRQAGNSFPNMGLPLLDCSRVASS